MKCPVSKSGTCLKSVSADIRDHPACVGECQMAATVRYQMLWPAWFGEAVKRAAKTRALTTAAWLRQAAIEKMERDNQDDP